MLPVVGVGATSARGSVRALDVCAQLDVGIHCSGGCRGQHLRGQIYIHVCYIDMVCPVVRLKPGLLPVDRRGSAVHSHSPSFLSQMCSAPVVLWRRVGAVQVPVQ